MSARTMTTRTATVFLGALLAFAYVSPAPALPIATAPSGDLNADGQVTSTDLQCQILLFESLQIVGELTQDHCRPAFKGYKVCLPECLHDDIALGADQASPPCPDPQVTDADCVGGVSRHNADLNGDGRITNIDFQFLVSLLLGRLTGPDSPDFDGDGILNFSDPDSDGDGDPDETDCGLLDPTRGSGSVEICDNLDNDCDILVDTEDPDFFNTATPACEKLDGVCVGSFKPHRLCIGGNWDPCDDATYAAHDGSYEIREASCDALDNDCDADVDAADGDVTEACCFEAGDCDDSFRDPPSCDDTATCQGHRVDATCEGFVCGSNPTDDDTACGASVVAKPCGMYKDVVCDGSLEQSEPACPESCAGENDCDEEAHCDDDACVPDVEENGTCDERSDCAAGLGCVDGTCIPVNDEGGPCSGHNNCIGGLFCNSDTGLCEQQRENGGACKDDETCLSGHCSGGICCAAGDCCLSADDCPPEYDLSFECTDPAACQGKRTDPACVQFSCRRIDADDDTGCTAGVPADTCGPYPDLFCNGEPVQDAPVCASSCTTADDCDPAGICEDGSCRGRKDAGETCAADNECDDLHCQNGYCCEEGDCCVSAEDCPASYSAEPICTARSACQGIRQEASCEANQCSSTNTPDDSGCDEQTEANACELYDPVFCNGQQEQTAPECPTGCSDHAECDDGAFCVGGACSATRPDGMECAQDGDCASDHCRNGFCCQNGVDCCGEPDDCPAGYRAAASCQKPSTCQGRRMDATCESYQCGAVDVDDDSACDETTVSATCGAFASVFCNGQAEQSAPACPTSCQLDRDCDEGAHCDGGDCLPDTSQGGICNEDSDCAEGLVCRDGFCAKQSGTGGGCALDTECTDGNHCDEASGQCVPDGQETVACGADSDCEDGLHCQNGRCEADQGEGEGCASDRECAEGTHCDEPSGTCLADSAEGEGCTTDNDCAEGHHCSAGACVADGDPGDGCAADRNCAEGTHCNEATGLCEADKEPGEGCLLDSDCQDGFICTDGTCSQAATGGEGCATDSQCADGYHCDEQSGECAADAGEEEGCREDDDCAEALTCVLGECKPKNTAGDFCLNDGDCEEGFHCDEESSRCEADQVSGGGCQSDSDCTEGLTCREGSCAEPGGGGTACTGPADCAEGLRCDTASGECVAAGGSGEGCTSDDDCAGDLTCKAGTCQVGSGSGDDCGADGDCADGRYCKDGKCAPLEGNGAACTESSQCASGHCDNGLCCDGGTCCSTIADCDSFAAPATCFDTVACQGVRSDALCEGSTCAGVRVDDDSGCTDALPGKDCAPYARVTCDGSLDQVEPQCATQCVDDTGCDEISACTGGACTTPACILAGTGGQTSDCVLHLARGAGVAAEHDAVILNMSLAFAPARATPAGIYTCSPIPFPCLDRADPAFYCETYFPEVGPVCDPISGECAKCTLRAVDESGIELSSGHQVRTCAQEDGTCDEGRLQILIFGSSSRPITGAFMDDAGEISGQSAFVTVRFNLHADGPVRVGVADDKDFDASNATARGVPVQIKGGGDGGPTTWIETGAAEEPQ